jgi:hypothetical protein
VHAPVVDDLQPRGEQPVEFRELDAVVDLDEELIADGPEEPLDLPPSLSPLAGLREPASPPRRRTL